MQRIVIKHLSGSKMKQIEEFPLNLFQELTLGRDATSDVRYSSELDRDVGRQHARITQDRSNPSQFFITDLNSHNGTYVNKQRITGTVNISTGDIVQCGENGPGFQFCLEPETRAVNSIPKTKSPLLIAKSFVTQPLAQAAPKNSTVPIDTDAVQQLVAQVRRQPRKNPILTGALRVIIALVAVALIYQSVGSTNPAQNLKITDKKADNNIAPVDVGEALANNEVAVAPTSPAEAEAVRAPVETKAPVATVKEVKKVATKEVEKEDKKASKADAICRTRGKGARARTNTEDERKSERKASDRGRDVVRISITRFGKNDASFPVQDFERKKKKKDNY